MDKKQTALIISAVTLVLCGFPGFCLFLYGALSALGVATYSVNVPGTNTGGQTPASVGFALLCLGLLLAAIPLGAFAYAFMKYRKPKAPVSNEPLPPAL